MPKMSLASYLRKKRGLAAVILILAVILAVFHIYTGLFGTLEAYLQRSIHLLLGLCIIFLLETSKPENTAASRVWGLACVFLAALSIGYIFVNYGWVTWERFPMVTPLTPGEEILGPALIILVLEAVRRTVGMILVYVVLAFLVYPFLGPYLPGVLHTSHITWTELVDFLYLSTEGIFGTTLGVSATVIALFIFFGAFIASTGTGNLLFELASTAVGKSKGGPAKIAVLASALFGSINGAPTANVTTTGVLTIPMMKKLGYQPHFAGAVEACASTGGQLLPPVMGATAFVIVAFTGIPYSTLIKYALLPAIIYFLSVYVTVHLEALRLNLNPMPATRSGREVLKDYGHMVIPIGILVYLLVSGFSPSLAGAIAVMFMLLTSVLKYTTRPSLAEVLQSFENGAKAALVVITATAAAGIIIGIINLTGLGQRLAAAIVLMGGDNLTGILILIAALSIILGMGMPTTPAYVLQAGLTIPALMQLGLPTYVAHLFVFYFCCLSLITPPVAVSSYAAAAIAEANIMKTGFAAFRMAIPSFIIPFTFAYNPALLLVGTPWQVLLAAVTVCLGVFALATALEGFLQAPLSWWERICLLAAAGLLIPPLESTIIPGLVLTAVVLVWQHNPRGRGGHRNGISPKAQ